METVSNSDVDAVETIEDVYLTQLANTENASVQHFDIRPGAVVDEHSHHQDQVGFVFSGELVFIVDGEEIPLAANDSFAIPGGEPHAAENRSHEPAVGVEIFTPPRETPPWET